MYCPGCGKEIPEGYSGPNCPSCGASFVQRQAIETGPAGIPWEDRSRLGFLNALLATLRLCLSDPTRFFSDLPKRENLGSAIQYLLLLTWLGALGGILWSWVLKPFQLAFLKSLGMNAPEQSWAGGMEGLITVVVAVMIPILVLITTFIWTGIVHVFLWILGGAKEGYEATLRVYAYSRGSTALFEWIPVCGGLVAFIWSLILQIIGLSRVHEIGGGKAALAVLLPLALCCVIIAAIVLAFLGAIMALLGISASA
ncbi:MAG: YIP1 family protein [Acidobacteria bacterium]|nr:YIP1 family protein [Acidobacteriota bacterium]